MASGVGWAAESAGLVELPQPGVTAEWDGAAHLAETSERSVWNPKAHSGRGGEPRGTGLQDRSIEGL